jgi:hypothetical protein
MATIDPASPQAKYAARLRRNTGGGPVDKSTG